MAMTLFTVIPAGPSVLSSFGDPDFLPPPKSMNASLTGDSKLVTDMKQKAVL